MSTEYFENIMENCLKFTEMLDDWDSKLINKFKIMSKEECFNEIHNPTSKENLKKAYNRLIFDKSMHEVL